MTFLGASGGKEAELHSNTKFLVVVTLQATELECPPASDSFFRESIQDGVYPMASALCTPTLVLPDPGLRERQAGVLSSSFLTRSSLGSHNFHIPG